MSRLVLTVPTSVPFENVIHAFSVRRVWRKRHCVSMSSRGIQNQCAETKRVIDRWYLVAYQTCSQTLQRSTCDTPVVPEMLFYVADEGVGLPPQPLQPGNPLSHTMRRSWWMAFV